MHPLRVLVSLRDEGAALERVSMAAFLTRLSLLSIRLGVNALRIRLALILGVVLSAIVSILNLTLAATLTSVIPLTTLVVLAELVVRLVPLLVVHLSFAAMAVVGRPVMIVAAPVLLPIVSLTLTLVPMLVVPSLCVVVSILALRSTVLAFVFAPELSAALIRLSVGPAIATVVSIGAHIGLGWSLG